MISDSLYTLNNKAEYCPLSKIKIEIFNETIEILNKHLVDKNVIITYRGENKTRLFERLMVEDLNTLLYKIFHIGDKGKYFLQCEFHLAMNDINDVSRELFSFIFDRISNIENENSATNEFKQYFTDYDNKNKFIEQVVKIEDCKTKLRIRDYYLVYLHAMENTHTENNCTHASHLATPRICTWPPRALIIWPAKQV